VLVWYKAGFIIIISSNIACSRYDIAEINGSFGVNQQSLTHPVTHFVRYFLSNKQIFLIIRIQMRVWDNYATVNIRVVLWRPVSNK